MSATAVSRNTTYPKPGPPAIKARATGGIVVAIDGSPGSMAALVPAFALASARKCAIQVVSVIPPFASYRYGAEIDESESQIESLRVNNEGVRYALVVHAGFRLRDREVKGYLVIVLSVSSLDRLVRAVEQWEQSSH